MNFLRQPILVSSMPVPLSVSVTIAITVSVSIPVIPMVTVALISSSATPMMVVAVFRGRLVVAQIVVNGLRSLLRLLFVSDEARRQLLLQLVTFLHSVQESFALLFLVS
jgi:hypothetical protein